MKRPLVKICGNTNIDDAKFALGCGADLLGFIFHEKSPRYITPEKAGIIINTLKEKHTFESVGVFVNPSKEYADHAINISGIDLLQFHGEETIAFIKQFNKITIKAFRIHDRTDISKCDNYDSVDYFLLDAFSKEAYGGTGKVFDWNLLDDFKFRSRLFLSGGISSGNINEAVNKIKPYGIDLCSSIEKAPGIKDHDGIKNFFTAFLTGQK